MKTKNQSNHFPWHLIVTFFLSNFITCFAFASPTLVSVNSLKGNTENGKDAYHTCALCHTPEGWGNKNGYYPQLSGQHPNVLIKQLIDIRLGNRNVPTMIPFADEIFNKGHQNVADVVSYIATLPMTPKNSVGKGDNLELGKKLYTQQCETCHGAKAEGDNAKSFPLLQGQHYQYLLRQMRWIESGERENSDEIMRLHVKTFTDSEMQAVADYVSRIKPDKDKVAESDNWQNPDFHDGFVSVPDKSATEIPNNKSNKKLQ